MKISYLIQDDFHTPTWKRFTQTLQAELVRLRESNDASTKDQIETAVIRGRIAAIKEALALAPARAVSARDNAAPWSWEELESTSGHFAGHNA